MKTIVWLCLAILLFSAVAAPAVEFNAGGNYTLRADETVDDDLLVFGENVIINGTVTGDLIAAASTISVNGEVKGNIMAAGETVMIAGRIGRSARLAGNQVSILSQIGNNLAAAGSTVHLAPGAKVGKDAHLAGQSVTLAGAVGRSAGLAGSQVFVSGSVGKDLRVESSSFNPASTLRVGGNLSYRSEEQVQLPPGAHVGGEVNYISPPPKQGRGGWYIWELLMALGAIILGVVALSVAPRFTFAAANAVSQPAWKSLLYGFMILFFMPLVVTLIAITVIGIPLAMVLLAAYLVALLLCGVPVAIAYGRWLAKVLGGGKISPYLALLLGVVIIALLMQIPYLGGLVRFAVLLFGLGALARAFKGLLVSART